MWNLALTQKSVDINLNLKCLKIKCKDRNLSFFAEKASDEMDKLWDENNWSDQTMDKWLEGDENTIKQ